MWYMTGEYNNIADVVTVLCWCLRLVGLMTLALYTVLVFDGGVSGMIVLSMVMLIQLVMKGNFSFSVGIVEQMVCDFIY